MPAEIFGAHYQFLDKEHLLSFNEMESVVKAAVELGVKKVRLTGGEPLLRRGVEDLVALLSSVPQLDEIAMTTNGVLLGLYAERLALAGLSRVTVSLDAIEPEVFSKMNGVGAKIDRVLKGIDQAQLHELPVKINTVVQKGVNESQIIPLLEYALERDIQLRFIEYMDVGETNNWQKVEVLPTAEIHKILKTKYDLMPEARGYGAVAENYEVYQGTQNLGKMGFISSVTRPFCADCGRIRISADGKAYGCLFATSGTSLKELLRQECSQEELLSFLRAFWSKRDDRYSELRGKVSLKKVEMSYIGG